MQEQAMPVYKNQFGVPQYPKGDARRLFVLLSAIDILERPTASALADLTGIDRETIDGEMAILREQYGIELHKLGEVYRIDSWGEVLCKEAVMKFIAN